MPKKELQMYIPEIGDKIQLTENWAFALYPENRNKTLFKALQKFDPNLEKLGRVSVPEWEFPWMWQNHYNLKTIIGKVPGSYWDPKKAVMVKTQIDRKKYIEAFKMPLMKDDILKVDRIYIRKGSSDYSSITFYLLHTSNPLLVASKEKTAKTFGRFWAKLSDVNNIKFVKV